MRLYIRKTGNPVWDGYLWWQADSDTTWDAARRVAITEPTYIDEQAAVTVNAEWTGTLNQIRIDLSAAQTADDCFEVSYVYIGRPSPGASQAQVSGVQQALASQILAEATSREALSVALTGLADPTGATIPSLSQGLLYDERVARVSGDEANTLLIQGVAARIEDPSTGLDALAQVQSTMQGQISSLDGVVTVIGQSIDDLLLSVDDLETGKADIGITDGLQAQINQMGGGEGLSLLAESMRSMRLTVDRLALGQAGVWLAGQNDRRELGNIVADVHQEATSRIDVTDDQVALHGRILDQINLDLGGKAGLDIVSALDGRVTATEGEIETIGTSLVSINASIGDLETGKADASAVNGLTTRVTDTEAGLQSLSEALIDVDATVGNMSAGGRWRVQATATEAGALATAGLGLVASEGGVLSEAALLMSAHPGGKSAVGVVADLFYVKDPAGRFDPWIIESGAAYFNRARIRDLDAVNFTAEKIDAKLILQNGSVIEDLIDVDTFSRFEDLPYTLEKYFPKGASGSSGGWYLAGTLIIDKPADKPCMEFIDINLNVTRDGAGSVGCSILIKRNGDGTDLNSGDDVIYRNATANWSETISETKMRSATLAESALRYDLWVSWAGSLAGNSTGSISFKCNSGVWVFR